MMINSYAEVKMLSGHVNNMYFNSEVQPAVIKGDVHASMKKRTYNVQVSVDLKKQEVISSSCTCPRGQVVCHHMAALLYNAHHNISSTDIERQWGTSAASSSAKSRTEDSIQTIDEIYPKQPYTAMAGTINTIKIEAFRQSLGQNNVVGFSWLLKPEADEAVYELVPSIENILFSEEYFNIAEKEAYFLEKCLLSLDKIQEIAQLTVGQHSNESWMLTRKNRLTASKFGLVLKACQRGKYPPSLFKSLVEGYSMDRVLGVQWGKDNEQTAIEKFVNESGLSVVPTGLWLDQCGFIGASPDGLVGLDSILEVKCPYKFRNQSIKDGVKNKYYLFHYENDDILVDRTRSYYHQIQGQLFITQRQHCHFFVWTPTEYECVLIERDEEWSGNLDILKKIYLQKFLPVLLK